VLPRGSVLVLVGDVELDAAVAQLERALGGWTGAETAAELPPLPPVAGGDIKFVPRPGAVQSQLRLTAEGIMRTDPRYPALQLANLAFGGFFSSRLVENIREDKGYTYHARSHMEFTPHGALYYTNRKGLSFQCHPEFCEDFASDLLISRRGIRIDAALVDRAVETLKSPSSRNQVIGVISNFLGV